MSVSLILDTYSIQRHVSWTGKEEVLAEQKAVSINDIHHAIGSIKEHINLLERSAEYNDKTHLISMNNALKRWKVSLQKNIPWSFKILIKKIISIVFSPLRIIAWCFGQRSYSIKDCLDIINDTNTLIDSLRSLIQETASEEQLRQLNDSSSPEDQEAIKQLQQQLDEKQRIIEQQAEKIDTLQQQEKQLLEKFRSTLNKITKEKEELEQLYNNQQINIEGYNEAIKHLEERITDLTSKLEEEKKYSDELNNTNDLLMQQINELRIETANLKKQIESLNRDRTENQTSEQKTFERRTSLTKEQQRYQELQKEFNNLQEEYLEAQTSYFEDRDKQQNRISALQEKINNLEAKLQEKIDHINTLQNDHQQEIENRQKIITSRDQEIQTLREQIAQLEARKEKALDELSKLDRENEELSQQLKTYRNIEACSSQKILLNTPHSKSLNPSRRHSQTAQKTLSSSSSRTD